MSDSQSMTAEQIKSKRIPYLILSTLVLLFLGLIYAYSMFAKPMVADFGLQGSPSLTFNIMMVTFCVGAIAGAFLDKAIGVRNTLLICALFFVIGFVGTGLMAQSMGLMALYVFYGVFGGLGCGFGYNTIVATTNVWFPDKTGFSSGVLMMGFGVSSLIFGNLSLAIRPMVGGMGPVLIGIAVVVAALVVILAFVLKRPPANIVEIMAPEKVSQGGKEIGENDNIFGTPIFWVYYIWGIIVIAVGLTVIGNCAQVATGLGLDEGFASLLVGLVSTFNGLSRIVIGTIYDKTNIKITMAINAVIAALAVSLIVAAVALDINMLFVVGALFCGFAYGGVPVIASAFARQRYGSKKYPVNLSIVNFSIALASFLNLIIASVIGTAAENPMGVFSLILALAVIAVIDVFFFSKLWKRDVEEEGAL